MHSTGTGAMEAVVSNILSPGDEAICVCAGKFGERWKEIARAYGVHVHSIDAPPGDSAPLKSIEKELESKKSARALFMTACETSTATEQPIKETSELLKKRPEVLFVVDGITALGAMELRMDEWGIDALVAGSQKSFMLPAGLAFAALSEKAWSARESSRCPKYYFDLKKEKEAQSKGQTAFSSSVTLLFALKESLSLIKAQGLESAILKCRALKESTHAFCGALGLALYSKRPASAVTAIQLPPGLSAEKIKKNLQARHNVVVAGGQGELKNKILRLGHLGPIGPGDQMRGLKALAEEMKKEAPKLFDEAKIKDALKRAEKILKAEKRAGGAAGWRR